MYCELTPYNMNVCCAQNLAILIIFDISSNPVSSSVSYFRLFTIYHLKNLRALDGSTIVSNAFVIMLVVRFELRAYF